MFRLYSGLSSPAFEYRIVGNPTVDPAPAAPADNALRAELIGQIANAQFDLDAAASQGDSAVLASADAQRQELAALLRAIAATGPAGLAAIRAAVAATATTSATIVQQARASASAADAAELAESRIASRATVQALVSDLHRFDPYLQFASEQDETEYRHREAERRAYIEHQHAKATPEGDLNAAGAAVGQMVDAKAHGADQSPEFGQRWNRLAAATDRLRDAARATGQPTEEFDRNLRDDLRRALKAKGFGNAEIDARLAASGDPLQAARDFVRSDQSAPAQPVATVAPADHAPVSNLADAMAQFRAAGIVAAEHPPGDPLAHGLAANERPAPAPGRSTG